jgi:hypothetical protein
MTKPDYIPQVVWDGLNEAGKFYLNQGARLVDGI